MLKLVKLQVWLPYKMRRIFSWEASEGLQVLYNILCYMRISHVIQKYNLHILRPVVISAFYNISQEFKHGLYLAEVINFVLHSWIKI